jgi:hypothetical protein
MPLMASTERYPRPRTIGRMIVAFVCTVAACGLAAIAAIINGVFWDSTGTGGLICPDGGDEIWTRPGVGTYAIWLLAGAAITGTLWLCLRTLYRRLGVWRPRLAAALVAGSSAGSLTLFFIAYDVANYWNTPDRYRCGESFDGTSLPAALGPALIALFVVALGAVFAAPAIARLRAAAIH